MLSNGFRLQRSLHLIALALNGTLVTISALEVGWTDMFWQLVFRSTCKSSNLERELN